MLLGLGVSPGVAASPPGQQPLDTLKTGLRRPGLADTLRVKYLSDLSGLLQSINLDSARHYGQRALALARRLGYRRGEVLSLNTLAGAYRYAGDNVAAQRTYEACLRLSQQLKMPKAIGNSYVGLANVAQAQENWPLALRYLGQARLAYAAMRPPNVNGQLLVLNNIGSVHRDRLDFAASVRTLREALPLLAAPGAEPRLQVSVLNNLGEVYLELHHSDSALTTLTQALAVAQAAGNVAGESRTRAFLAAAYLKQGQPGPAVVHANRARVLARQAGRAGLEELSLLHLSHALRAQGQPAAYDSLRRYLTLHDRRLAEEHGAALLRETTRFNDATQQARIRALEQDRRLTRQSQELSRLRAQRQVAGATALALLALAGAALVLWRYRQRQAAREAALRTRIAADLHDDVGSLLTQISLESEMLREGLYAPNEQSQQLSRLADVSRTAVRQMNDVVWGLDARHDSMADLLDRLRDHAHEVLAPAGLEIDFAADPGLDARPLRLEARQSLYLLYKEALHNVVKHARGATLVQVRLSADDHTLTLRVHDDGQGTKPKSGTGAGGHGQGNMARRAASAGGTLRSGGCPEGGFEVVAQLPLGN